MIDILLVEDNIHDEALTRHALQHALQDLNVKILHDGEEALSYLFNDDKNVQRVLPNVIFLDLKLPKIDGLTVLKKIKDDEKLRLIPVVILSSSMQDIDIQRAYELGVNSYVVKPVHYEELKRVIGLLGKYWVNINQTTQW